MKSIDIGPCCTDCFDAINGMEGAKPEVYHAIAQVKLANDLHSVHTGDHLGFSWHVCNVCKSILGGERFECFGLTSKE